MIRFLIGVGFLVGIIEHSHGQRTDYTPYQVRMPGPRVETASAPVHPADPDQTAALSFIAEDFGIPLPTGGQLEWLDMDADQDGFTVWDEEPWKPVIVYGSQKQTISVVAPTFKATDFRLILQSPDNSGQP